LDIKRFAAIDIGSNSVRLLIENVLEQEGTSMFKKSSLIRVPVRLGSLAFTGKKIPEKTVDRLVSAMLGFRHLMEANEVLHYKGCATSAMREAINGKEIIDRIRKEAGVKIDIISGSMEADIIFRSQSAFLDHHAAQCLFVDVGGGSTEITVFDKNRAVAARSFNIGTLRILGKLIDKKDWKEMREWARKNASDGKMIMIGSGGNINRISKLAQLKAGKALSIDKLEEIYLQISRLSVDERIRQLDLNPDRADVIVPAAEIFLNLMKWLEIPKIYIPKIGLSDGLVREVYREYLEKKKG
jgi:exopolyphosphatase/guanosine-5'-triphosphate,3'-diphosphate pyrophosphatase